MKTCPRCDSILADNESPYCDNCGYDPDFDRDNEWYSQMSKRVYVVVGLMIMQSTVKNGDTS